MRSAKGRKPLTVDTLERANCRFGAKVWLSAAGGGGAGETQRQTEDV